jgi:hypothetical protein
MAPCCPPYLDVAIAETNRYTADAQLRVLPPRQPNVTGPKVSPFGKSGDGLMISSISVTTGHSFSHRSADPSLPGRRACGHRNRVDVFWRVAGFTIGAW